MCIRDAACACRNNWATLVFCAWPTVSISLLVPSNAAKNTNWSALEIAPGRAALAMARTCCCAVFRMPCCRPGFNVKDSVTAISSLELRLRFIRINQGCFQVTVHARATGGAVRGFGHGRNQIYVQLGAPGHEV